MLLPISLQGQQQLSDQDRRRTVPPCWCYAVKQYLIFLTLVLRYKGPTGKRVTILITYYTILKLTVSSLSLRVLGQNEETGPGVTGVKFDTPHG